MEGQEASRAAQRLAELVRHLRLEDDDLARMRRLPLFAGLDDRQLAELLDAAQLRRFDRNALLFLQGEPAKAFYVVLDGWVRLFRASPGGHETTIALFGRGESLAEAAILDSAVYPVCGSACEEARLLVFGAEPFLQRLRLNPGLCLNLLASMSRHLRGLVQQVEQLTARSSVERVADFLLRLCPTQGLAIEIELPLDKSLIAGRLGMQPETLSRSLARLRTAGVETIGNRVLIRDALRLRSVSSRRR